VNSRTGASVLVYTVLLLCAVFEQFGRTTNDTKTPLIERTGQFLREATTLWDPATNFGELQNQAYGYLFPQGPFYLLAQLAHLPPWIAERFWTVLLVVVGAEGARLLARTMGLGPWAAWVAGMAYGLNPRVVSQMAVRSAEILPTAVLPWVALPIVLALTGRLGPRRAALFSAAAFMFSGAVNGTATAAGLPLIVILIVWGIRRKLVSRSLLGWWSLLIVVTNFWWAASLLRLNYYSPPFFDYVEDAKATTETTGFTSVLRGLSNWVNYAYLGNAPNWPAGYDGAFEPGLVVAGGLLAAVAVIGLVSFPRPWRAPLVASAVLGVVCLTVAHSAPLGSPIATHVQNLLDGAFALLRNVSKADPMLRLPLCLGVGAAFARVLALRVSRPTRTRTLLVAAVVALVFSVAQPAVAFNLRTPGWTKVPDYWSQAADYLEKSPGEQRAWIVPGSGFGLQTWGWTMDEPFQGVAKSPWVSRSQVPLTPPATIRILSTLEQFLETGSGSPNLGQALGRLGIGYVVVRHDLDEAASDTTTANLVAIAMARSRGVERVALFGTLDLGPAIEIYRVTSAEVAPPVELRPLEDAVTVASASSDVIDAVVEGLIGRRQPAIVQGDKGWEEPADIVGDSYRVRERNFGRVHGGEGPVRAVAEPLHGNRIVPDYPANEGSKPVRADFDGGAYVTASSSQAWTSGLGRVAQEQAPYAAFDRDRDTGWSSAYYQEPKGQWVEARWPTAQAIGRVVIRSPFNDPQFATTTRWKVTAGDRTVLARNNPFTGLASADLAGVRATNLRITADKVSGAAGHPVSVFDVRSDSTPIGRSMVLPPVETTDSPSFVFSAQPETRACIATLLGADCSESRRTLSEESSDMDRTFEVPASGTWNLTGTAVARSRPGVDALLNPLGSRVVLHASSQWLSDPAVSVRLAYDGATTTSWVADPRDAAPKLTVDFDRPRTISRIAVSPPAAPAITPTSAVIRSRQGVRRVELGEFGQFAPLRTSHLTITFANPTRGLAPIGVGELSLPPATVATPLNGGDITGSVCGLGPVVTVDGMAYRTQVRGFIGDIVSAGPLRFESCSGPIPLTAGSHRLRIASTEQFQAVKALLRAPEGPTPEGAIRPLGRVSGTATRQVARVGPGAEAILTTTRNLNRGWTATLDGRPLDPMISDGWAQAWRVPAGAGGDLVISYAPQRIYLVSLYGGMAVAAAVLLLAMVMLFRTRLRPVRPIPERGPPSPRRWVWASLVVLAVPVAWLLGGVPAAAAVVVGAVVPRPQVLRLLAAALLVAAPLLVAWELRDGPQLRFDTADLLAGGGFVLALMSTMPRPRRTSAPAES